MPCLLLLQPPPQGNVPFQFWRNGAMNPQFNTVQISQGSPGETTTHPQESESKVLIPEEPHLIWSTLQELGGWQSYHQLGREGVGRLWELHIWQCWMKLVPTPRLFATALLMLALHRESRRSSRQRKDLFQAAAK